MRKEGPHQEKGSVERDPLHWWPTQPGKHMDIKHMAEPPNLCAVNLENSLCIYCDRTAFSGTLPRLY